MERETERKGGKCVSICQICTFKRGSRELLMFQFWFSNDSN